MKETMLMDVLNFIKEEATDADLELIKKVTFEKGVKITTNKKFNYQLRNARGWIRNVMNKEFAIKTLGEEIYKELLEEGFIYENGNKIIKT